MQPLLSICIPTYNRSKILKRTLTNLEKYTDFDVEIIISDNKSKDNTEIFVKQFKNLKVKYFKNSFNMGLTYNIIKSLELAKGEFCVLTSDEDDLNISNIISYIQRYSFQSPNIIMGSILNSDASIYTIRRNRQIKKGNIAFLKHNLDHGYISGLVLRRSKIDFNQLWLEYNKSNNGLLSIYPHVYVLKELLLMGNTHTSNSVFCLRRDVGKNFFFDKYFIPSSRLNQLQIDLEYIKNKNFGYIFELFLITKRYHHFLVIIESFIKSFDNKINQNYYDFNEEEFRNSLKDIASIKIEAKKTIKMFLSSNRISKNSIRFYLLIIMLFLLKMKNQIRIYSSYFK